MFDKSEASNTVLADYIGLFRERGIPLYSVLGQHDIFMRNRESVGRTATAVAVAAGVVRVLTDVPKRWDDGSFQAKPELPVSVYGMSWGDTVPELKPTDPDFPEDGNDDFTILVAHAPVYAKSLYPGHEPEGPEIFAEKCSDYDVVLLGDSHSGFELRTIVKGHRVEIVCIGCLTRQVANEAMKEHKPHFYILDTSDGSLERIEIPHEPYADVFDVSLEEKASDVNMATVAELINKLRKDRSELSSFEERIEAMLLSKEITPFAAEFIRKALAETGEANA